MQKNCTHIHSLSKYGVMNYLKMRIIKLWDKPASYKNCPNVYRQSLSKSSSNGLLDYLSKGEFQNECYWIRAQFRVSTPKTEDTELDLIRKRIDSIWSLSVHSGIGGHFNPLNHVDFRELKFYYDAELDYNSHLYRNKLDAKLFTLDIIADKLKKPYCQFQTWNVFREGDLIHCTVFSCQKFLNNVAYRNYWCLGGYGLQPPWIHP